MIQIIKRNTIQNALKTAKAERVSEDAIKKLQKHMNEYLLIQSAKIVKEAQYSGRKTIFGEDVDLVLNKKNDDRTKWET